MNPRLAQGVGILKHPDGGVAKRSQWNGAVIWFAMRTSNRRDEKELSENTREFSLCDRLLGYRLWGRSATKSVSCETLSFKERVGTHGRRELGEV